MNKLNKKEVFIDEINISDETFLWIWRNDPLTIKMAKNQKKVSWFEHTRWLKKIKREKKVKIFIARRLNYEKVGMCRFQKNRNDLEVSINIDSRFRGNGFSYFLLENCLKKLKNYKKLKFITTVRKENLASIKCFTKCGFLLETEDNGFLYYKRKG